MVLGKPPGLRGLVVADLDADGDEDILSTGGYSGGGYVYVLRAAAGGGYQLDCVLPGTEWAQARVAQVDDAGHGGVASAAAETG